MLHLDSQEMSILTHSTPHRGDKYGHFTVNLSFIRWRHPPLLVNVVVECPHGQMQLWHTHIYIPTIENLLLFAQIPSTIASPSLHSNRKVHTQTNKFDLLVHLLARMHHLMGENYIIQYKRGFIRKQMIWFAICTTC